MDFQNVIPPSSSPSSRQTDRVFAYGTAGFREHADVLPPVMYRVGLLATLRSKYKKGSAIGVMITASHNPEPDNGVKIVDPYGEMLESSWEKYASKLANCPDENLGVILQEIATAEDIDLGQSASVIVARDTRPSGPVCHECVVAALKALAANITDCGILTTPQLHFVVRCTNDSSYGIPTAEGYYRKLADAFSKVYDRLGRSDPIKLKLDCANGVGAMHFEKLAARLKGKLEVIICNDGSSGKLNDKCGADYVKTNQSAPPSMSSSDGELCASFDGDADRLMFFFNENGNFSMLDGDRIAILCAIYLNEKLSSAGLKLNLGIVQTAYANGGSTAHVSKLGIPVACAKTGVKNLHHLALNYDLGVYFEANGHGTVLFSDNAMKSIRDAASSGTAKGTQAQALNDLLSIMDVINQTVGDAISDLLLVELILAEKNMSPSDWAQMYHDLPNRLLKVKIQDRTVVQTTNAERTCTAPEGLQAAIDEAVEKYPQARSFVRPSGTEDVVRVYAETSTRENTDRLALLVSQLVYDIAGGIGERPTTL